MKVGRSRFFGITKGLSYHHSKQLCQVCLSLQTVTETEAPWKNCLSF